MTKNDTALEANAAAAKANILIIDDTPGNLRFLTEMLTRQGYVVRPVLEGHLAIASAQAEAPDLILLDIMMPKMNGYEVCERLKADERTRDIPVIFLSALSEVHDKLKAFRIGGVDYVTKPFQMEEVLARVETHLALQKLQRDLQEKNAQLEREITERERAQTALQQYAYELEIRNAELDAFAHTVAHDLKAPLSLVSGYADLLTSDYDTMEAEELRQVTQAAARGAHKMADIIESLLLLASTRKVEVKPQALNMARIVAEVQQRLSPMIEEWQAEISFPETWPAALGYEPWIEEVWANYISNAIKYGGRPPRVELGFSISDSGFPILTSPSKESQSAIRNPQSAIICFWVRDNGPGLTEKQQAKLFTPFIRLHKDRAEGHGLGLSIVQRIVEKLDGEVGVESEVGQGSVFWFTLKA